MKRVFVTVNRDILLINFNSYGVSGIILQWLESYLSNRKQIVKIGDTSSEEIVNNYGVPHGSVLGPLLFLIYINDMRKIIKNCKLHLFADDAPLSITGKNHNTLTNDMNEDLLNLSRCFEYKKLKINASKCKCMVIATKNQVEVYNSSHHIVTIDKLNL